MSNTEVQNSERLPMLSAAEENVNANPTTSVAVPIEPVTTSPKKETTTNANSESNTNFVHAVRPLLVELIGTTFFILIGLAGQCANAGLLPYALSFGLALMVFTASFGHISGVHFNPSVTLGVLISGEMQPILAILYIVVQLLGGIAAGGLLRLLLPSKAYGDCKGGATLLASFAAPNATSVAASNVDNICIWQGILIEFIVTFVFVTILIMVTIDTKSKTGLASLIVGLALVANILAAGNFTLASLNPARSLGPAIFSHNWANHYVYWIGPLCGAVVAGLLYRTVWAHNDRRMFVRRTATPAAKA